MGDADDAGPRKGLATRRETLCTNAGNDEEGDKHGDRGGEDKGATAETVNEEERAKDTDDFDDINDDGDDEGVLETDGGHEGNSVREDELHSTNLLTNQDTEDAGEFAQLNAVEKSLPAAYTGKLKLVLTSLSEGVVLESDDLVSDVVVLTLVDALEGSECLFVAILVDKPAGRLGDNKLCTDEDCNKEEVENDGDTVGPRRVDILGTLSNASTDNLTDGEHELPRRDDSATNGGRGDLGEVEGCAVRDNTDTGTENTSTEGQQRFRADSDELKDDADSDKSAGTEEATPTTDVVTQRRCKKRANNFTSLNDRGVEGLILRWNLVLTVGGVDDTEIALETMHLEDTSKVGTIVTIEDRTDNCKSAEEDGSNVGF